MKPNENFDNEGKGSAVIDPHAKPPKKKPAKETKEVAPEKDTPKEAKKEKPKAITPNASDIQEQKDNGRGKFYRIVHAGPFLYATDRIEDGFMFSRKGHEVKMFTEMIKARGYAKKNEKAYKPDWRKSLDA